MNNEIKSELFSHGVDIVRFVDISNYPIEQTLGFDRAILFCMVLSKKYVADFLSGKPFDWNNDEYLYKEKKVEDLADWIAGYIQRKGFRAHSQSDGSNKKSGYIEQAYIDPEMTQGISILPQKAIARASGLGFIGKNNLLVTEEYGSAITMCSVLTDAPITPENFPIIESKCGKCNVCVEKCDANALLGNEWTASRSRDDLVDVSKCNCALKCMMECPWTIRYIRELKGGKK